MYQYDTGTGFDRIYDLGCECAEQALRPLIAAGNYSAPTGAGVAPFDAQSVLTATEHDLDAAFVLAVFEALYTSRGPRRPTPFDAQAVLAAAKYLARQQRAVANFTNDGAAFITAFAAGYVVTATSENDIYLEDPEARRAELLERGYGQYLPEATVIDTSPTQPHDAEE